jgi:hypothetical protein
MRSHSILLLVIYALGLPACSSLSKKKAVATAPVKNSYTWQQKRLKPADNERVRTKEFVKTYHVGRSVSGRRGGVLHEAHRAYRLEKPSRWSLARNQPPLASHGPVNKVVDGAFKPAAQSQSIRAELKRQQALSEELEATSNAFTETVISAKEQFRASKSSGDALAHMRKEIMRLREENNALKKATPTPEEPATSQSPSDALLKWGKKVDESSSDLETK